ncbi:MAG: peptidoglycan DD-metalloendopeptidase family protein [Polyangiaceae bacterium]|nr:peptidoglycan DD-metalloendopeptidase family protein [Polyangiaceae bacterium]
MSAVRRTARRLLPPLAAVLVAGSAGAYVPGESTARSTTARDRRGAAAAEVDERDFERLLSDLDTRERKLEEELAALGAESDMVSRRLVARGRAYYRLVRAGLLPVGGGFDALVDYATQVERLRTSLGRDLEAGDGLRQRAVEIGDELKKVRAERAPLHVHRAAMERAKDVMREADERRAAFERAFGGGASVPGAGPVAVYGAGNGPLAGVGEGFASMRGRLSFPLGGRATLRAVRRASSNGPGLEFATDGDATVRAIFPGRVVFSDTYADFGRTVIVDHGDGYFSVYAGLGRSEALVGESVAERGTVGWLVRVGPVAPVLYFEIRKGKSTLDPGPWLGL